MKKFIYVLVYLLTALTYSLSYSQTFTNIEKEFLKYQDLRDMNSLDTLMISFGQDFEATVLRKLMAFANAGDSTVFKRRYLLNDYFTPAYPRDIRRAAFFMLSQIQSDTARRILRETLLLEAKYIEDSKYLNLTYDLSSKSELINSIGKNGDETDLDSLLNFFETGMLSDSVSYRALPMSIARFALRKIKNEKAVNVLQEIAAKTKDTISQRNIAFAFWRIGDKKLLTPAVQEIYDLSRSPDAQTRMWAYSALGKIQDEVFFLNMLETFDSEKDWRVKVNMLNSLTNFNIDSIPHLSEKIIEILGGYKKGESEHISLTRLNVLGKLFGGKKFTDSDDVKEGLIKIMDSPEYGWQIRSESANSLSLIFKDAVKFNLFNTFSSTDDYDLKSGVLKAFGNFDNGMIYKEVRDTISAEVQKYNAINPNTTGDLIGSKDLAKVYRAFVEMLSNLDEKVDEENQNTMRLIFTEFASSKDPIITDISLSALRDSLYAKYHPETSIVLSLDYGDFQYPKDLNAMLLYIDTFGEMKDTSFISILETNLNSESYELAKASADALEKITGKKYEFSAKPRTDFDWKYLDGLSQKTLITVKTNKGNIKIELLPDAAPFTVMNFLKLSEGNYYDGTIFHRVVSNFVIQGGDPTGTGYGGPGYSIRSEFSPLAYERGMVGMASSGKDTEGSQFFITHSATPHLDAKYTIFGKVTEGMDVVDMIMTGDYIENIVIGN